MSYKQPSDTYKELYFSIIDLFFKQICDNLSDYCIKSKVNNLPVPLAIYDQYETYKVDALEHMAGDRLDRHKLASCICGAIVEVQPLTGYNNAEIPKTSNETLAFYVGMEVVKYYMIYEIWHDSKSPVYGNDKAKEYITKNFSMQFPSNICDSQKYDINFANALYWSRQKRGALGDKCARFDTWAYAKLFFHLELHNRPLIEQAIADYLNPQPNTPATII